MAQLLPNRRRFLRTGAAVAAGLALSHVSTSRAAGTLSLGFWDHWVPGANEKLARICNEWATEQKVDLKIDFITSVGNKGRLTIVAESQAKAGHDVLHHGAWNLLNYASQLEPLDDVMNPLLRQHGDVLPAVARFCRADGRWLGVPNNVQPKPPCVRLDLFRQHAGLDLQAMFPVGAPTKAADDWTWETLLDAATKLHRAGNPIGLGLGLTYDSVDWTGALFAAYGAEPVDAAGAVTVQSDAMRQVLAYMQRLAKVLPSDVYAWDDASNNKYLISGQGSMIINPPSAWVVARRDNPKVAAELWNVQAPRGPKGRYLPMLPTFWAVWNFAKNKPAAKALIAHLMQRENVQALVDASQGFDVPGFERLQDFPVWTEAGPPTGTLYHYPLRPGQTPWVAGSPAPVPVARQIYTNALMPKMIAKVTQGGEPIDRTLAWAASELEGYLRS